jgi:hypothetical protein
MCPKGIVGDAPWHVFQDGAIPKRLKCAWVFSLNAKQKESTPANRCYRMQGNNVFLEG